MARRFDPVLKQWIDEPDVPGALPDPTAMPGVAPLELRADPSATPPQVAVNFPQKPLSEVETETQQRTASPDTVTATANLRAAETAADATSKALGVVEGKEADAAKVADDQRVLALKDQQAQQWEAEQERRRYVDAAITADQEEIEREKKARIDAGQARATYWEGRPGAEIFTRLLQVIGGVAHDVSGRGGPSPVDQAIEANIAAHEKRLVGQWEATKEANVLRRQNRAGYLNELDRRRIAAANQSQLSLDLVGEQLNAAIAGLGKEKQAAARAAADASIREKRAQLQQQSAQLYDAIGKRAETQRTLADGAEGGKLTQGQGELAGALTAMTTELKKFQDAKVSQAALERWRKNQNLMAGADRTMQSSGPFSLPVSAVVGDLQEKGFVPSKEFEGIPEAEEKAILQRKRALDQLSKIMTGAAATDSEVKRREQMWLIQPGDSDEIVAEKTQAFIDFIRDRSVGAGAAAPAIRQNLEGARAGAKPAAAAAPVTPARNDNDLSTWSERRLRAGMAEALRRGKDDPAAVKAHAAFSLELSRRKKAR